MNTVSISLKIAFASAIIIIASLILFSPAAISGAQNDPVPTLVPPTPFPTQPVEAIQVADYSGIATLQSEGMLRVGARFNLPPFSFIGADGELTGYEVDVVNAIATQLGVEVAFVQVTSENELEMLRTGAVDLLIGQQSHTREASQNVEFSHPYYLNKQQMVVLFESPYQSFSDLNGQPVSYVVQSRGEVALGRIVAANGLSYDLRAYFHQDDALDALANGDVQAMVGELDNLQRAGRQGMRLIEQPLQLDPYAIAVRRYDVNLRNILNRSLQRIWASGELTGLYNRWFEADLDFSVLVPVYESIGQDPRVVADFPTDLPIPASSVVDKIRNGEVINVAGLTLDVNDPYSQLIDPFNRALMDEMARRWGVGVNYVPGTVELMVSGQADITVGVTPRWDGADRFDYSRPYAFHGNAIMVINPERYGSFFDMRGGTYIGYWYEFPQDRAEVERIAEELRVRPSVYEFRSQQEIIDKFADRTVQALFGDNLRLEAIRRNTNSGLPFEILDEQYSLVPLAVAVPRNDADFRALVDWTLQDMFLDGTYQRIYNETFSVGEPITMITWPGEGFLP